MSNIDYKRDKIVKFAKIDFQVMKKKLPVHFYITFILILFINQQVFSQSDSLRILQRKHLVNSFVLLKNEHNIVPFVDLTKTMACISIGIDSFNIFQNRLSDYNKIDFFNLAKTETASLFNRTKNQLKNYDFVICSLQGLNKSPRLCYGVTKQMAEMVQFLADSAHAIIVLFGSPNVLNDLKGIEKANAILIANEESSDAQDLAAQLLFGGIGAKGKLQETVNEFFKNGDGLESKGDIRFQYCLPEELGMDSKFIENKVDSIVERGIKEYAFPGCQILAAKDGKLFFHKTYGFHTYDSISEVKKSDLYDYASITKISGTLPVLMKLYDEGKFKLDTTFVSYWPSFKHSNKKQIIVRDVLAHQAQLTAWVPFWKNTMKKNGEFKRQIIRQDSSKNFPVKINENMFLRRNYRNKIYKTIKKSKLLEKKEYVYSDLSFYLYPQIIKNITGIDFETYLKQNFFTPIGAYTLGYKPLEHFNIDKIIPTEKDTFFRMQQIHGTVHDEGAILMGGVSGHAGLFGTALDLAKMMQMYLNMGTYGGHRFISDSTLKEFTRCQFPENNNRRGLGFDKPLLKNKADGSSAIDASDKSFGHSGFTGTFCWADPENGILYVFMSNRVYPSRNNSKISQLNIRPSIHQVFYDAVKRADLHHDRN